MIEYDPWLRKVATGLLSPAHEALEDLVQEGRIAIWKARATHDAARGPLLVRLAATVATVVALRLSGPVVLA